MENEPGYIHMFYADSEMFLDQTCYELKKQGIAVTAEALARAQTLYDLAACSAFLASRKSEEK
jgi:hypothetical protein